MHHFVSKILIVILPLIAEAQRSQDKNELLNWCLDAKHHKTAPGPESSLFEQCTPWKNRSCCTEETTKKLHESNPYNFNYDHCPGKKMSEDCHRHFLQDHCFYECSPNVGPWVVSETRSWRKERYWKVPLCASDCQIWFNSCANDYTCTDNWSRNFDWINSTDKCSSGSKCRTNVCPKGATCQTIREIYGNAQTFCDTVWDNSWKYTNNSRPCMRLWFDGTGGNPNDAVAQYYAHIISGAATCTYSVLWYTFQLMAIWHFNYIM
ncbi:folate receptor beta-like isoform X2 [Panulirus ornatus]